MDDKEDEKSTSITTTTTKPSAESCRAYALSLLSAT